MDDDRLRVITGPTGAGKSALALALAERVEATILSADSRQIYRGFDIGTAKPSPEERQRVPHEGIDIVEPTVRYSAAQWADDATRWVVDARLAGRQPLLVGGTGFYLRALTAPLFDEPSLDEPRLRALRREMSAYPVEMLRRWCRALDPARADLGRAQLQRAIEVALLAGRRVSDLHVEAARPARFSARYLVVDPGPALGARLEARVDVMLGARWEDEVRDLVGSVPEDAPAWNATGYGAIRDVVRGVVQLPEARRRIIVGTRQYAKRQRTWIRHQLAGRDVTCVHPDDPRALDIARQWWDGLARQQREVVA